MSHTITLKRDCHALVIPSGEMVLLHAGTPVVVTQSLGGSFTVQSPALDGLYRIADRDADALGLSAREAPASQKAAAAGPVSEEAVWNELKSCYDPEIPVNIVDLGLVYDLKLLPRPAGGCRVEVKMTLTAPGCGMGPSIAADAQQKIASLPGVTDAEVAVVWDPPWSAEMMTPEGKRRLGMG
ncbi:MAG TPA: putative Fe-S cluster assembly protein SufT [Thermoanaerobaculia bacterium]|nr:putative Fe-S cluster assembly protein SufT [Thermoanaerobaculia bacterium]